MILLNPWWLLVPASALLMVFFILLWQMQHRRLVPFAATHWLRPATRRKWVLFRRPPLWMLLTASAVMLCALGTLHFAIEPTKTNDRPIHIMVAVRNLRGHEYGFIKIVSQSIPSDIRVIGFGKAVLLSPSQMIHGAVFPLAPRWHPSHITLMANGKVIWQKPIPPWTLHQTIGVALGRDIPPAVRRAIRAVSWVRIAGTGKPASLFIGHHLRRHFAGSELILASPMAETPIDSARPIAITNYSSVLSFVQFRHVLVHRLKFLRPSPDWQTLVQVDRRPWILQRYQAATYDWMVGSSCFDRSTNWPKCASFVIFMANALHLAGRVPPTPSLWMASGIANSKTSGEMAHMETAWALGLLASAISIGALWNLQSHRTRSAYPTD